MLQRGVLRVREIKIMGVEDRVVVMLKIRIKVVRTRVRYNSYK